ncbi:MAG: 2-amino-4-hydroxy-6-hydroxymethyldihydropteridine diphosphokinase [Candidatus Stygibacter australis]|nr:2-amino-4-hydroxy-6-hydroxymethyldihydropteridine diphosphokinase [Candidatus Stygibacter australis]MDP8321885.1 2-amino-4-hydroxy-6-hydroxymethyldihydropteridine diphosphokinase [Candidatus Stygibacter australis]
MKVYVGLGSNMGDRKGYLTKAKDMLKTHANIKILKESEILETVPYGITDQADFLNQVILIETELSANDVLGVCRKVEIESGRMRTRKWGPRTIDIDILFYEGQVIDTNELIIPHADLHNRKFVLESMLELAPEFIHPVLGESIQEIYNKLESEK